MTEYDFVSIEVMLTNLDGEGRQLAYKQVIPVSVLRNNNPNWFAHIIAIVNKLEVPHV